MDEEKLSRQPKNNESDLQKHRPQQSKRHPDEEKSTQIEPEEEEAIDFAEQQGDNYSNLLNDLEELAEAEEVDGFGKKDEDLLETDEDEEVDGFGEEDEDLLKTDEDPDDLFGEEEYDSELQPGDETIAEDLSADFEQEEAAPLLSLDKDDDQSDQVDEEKEEFEPEPVSLDDEDEYGEDEDGHGIRYVPETAIDYAAIDQEQSSESKVQLEINQAQSGSRGRIDLDELAKTSVTADEEAGPEGVDDEEHESKQEESELDEQDIETALAEKIGDTSAFQLVITLGDKELDTIVLDQDLATIGRDGDCDVVIDNLGTSRLHAQIERVGRFYLLRDMNSKTGTFIRGKKIEEYSLNYGDEIFLAKHTLQFQKAQIRGRFSKALRERAQQYQSPGMRSMPRQQLMRTMAVDFRNLAQKQSGAPAYIMMMGINRRYPITENVVFFGKSQDCDFLTPGFMIGERHVLLAHERKGFFLYHLGFLRPPRVNDKPIEKAMLEDGDLVQIGEVKFIFQLEEQE